MVPDYYEWSLFSTNLKISDIRNVLSQSTYDLATLAQSANINRWGLWRGAFESSDVTASNRLSTTKASPFEMKHFRLYNHNAPEPGWVGQTTFGGPPDAVVVDKFFITHGDYSITRSGDLYISATQLTEDDYPNHTYLGGGGNLTGGEGPTTGILNWMYYGKTRISASENTGAARSGVINIVHPDGTSTISISQGSAIFRLTHDAVSKGPEETLDLTFAYNEIGTGLIGNSATRFVTVDIPYPYHWDASFSPSAQPPWIEYSKHGDGSPNGGTLRIWCNEQNPNPTDREATMRVIYFDPDENPVPNDKIYIKITQLLNPEF